MSDPPTTLPLPSQNLPDPDRQTLHLPAIHRGATTSISPTISSPSSSHIREYRKGNWTIQETLTLITAKKLDDERRLKATTSAPIPDPTKAQCRTSGELRWKWVENYCWSQGCLRSQNQCNDKWDNLLRDYKKIRDYESKSSSSSDGSDQFPSYWTLDKHQRKEHNLPSNMVFEIYQAINDVLQRKHNTQSRNVVLLPSPTPVTIQPPPPSLPPPPPPMTAPTRSPSLVIPEQSSESLGTEESSENQESSETKRRKVRNNIGSSIMRSASVLARALQSCEEKKEKRHRELMELERRRIQMEEARNEVNQQGITNLVAAVTNLSGAIHSLISESDRQGRR
ncbi:trihelix transcription factor ASR3-like [Quillaja saponaria]|uniref:Trihelix transcription factor ASR3-like n=1 Tax=Quillaja saponaria TaxID=32244 RepID=A0AAD7PGT9_QUISA|nr:trihelix transcription factor ASR3-like [Quillaja saponaria]